MAKDAKGHGSEKRGERGGQLTPGTPVTQTMGIRQTGVITTPFHWRQSTDGTYKAPGPNDHPVQWDDGTKGYAASVHIAPSGSPAAQPPRDPTPQEIAAQHGIDTSHLNYADTAEGKAKFGTRRSTSTTSSPVHRTSQAVEVAPWSHPGRNKPPPWAPEFASAVSGFREKYGPPRDHAAEQHGFNSGMREINRLKRQGK